MLLGSAAVSTTTQFNLSYIPQYIDITNTATITRLRVTALGYGIICDLDASGIGALKNTRFQTTIASTVLNRIYLANGLVKGLNCLIEITNGATATNVYASNLSDNGKNATFFYQSVIQKVFANTGVTFTKFAVLALPSMASTDYVQVSFNDGCDSRLDQPELRGYMAQFQALDTTANDLKLDNLDSIISSVTVYVATDQQAYVQKYLPVDTILGRF
jgi:hypothetical protein